MSKAFVGRRATTIVSKRLKVRPYGDKLLSLVATEQDIPEES